MISDLAGWLGVIAAALTVASIVFQGFQDRRYVRAVDRAIKDGAAVTVVGDRRESNLDWALMAMPVIALLLSTVTLILWAQELVRQSENLKQDGGDFVDEGYQLEAIGMFVLAMSIGVAIVAMLIFARVIRRVLPRAS